MDTMTLAGGSRAKGRSHRGSGRGISLRLRVEQVGVSPVRKGCTLVTGMPGLGGCSSCSSSRRSSSGWDSAAAAKLPSGLTLRVVGVSTGGRSSSVTDTTSICEGSGCSWREAIQRAHDLFKQLHLLRHLLEVSGLQVLTVGAAEVELVLVVVAAGSAEREVDTWR